MVASSIQSAEPTTIDIAITISTHTVYSSQD